MNDPFEMTSIKMLDGGMIPFGSWAMADLYKDDDEMVDAIAVCMKHLLAQMREYEKRGEIIPYVDSIQFIVKRDYDWMGLPTPEKITKPQGCVAIKYTGRYGDERKTKPEAGREKAGG